MSNELYHYGILGMKWGVRRYQNKDGSLTADGKEKLKKYKNKELVKSNTKYIKSITKIETKASKYKSKKIETSNDNKKEKYSKKIEQLNAMAKAEKFYMSKEAEAIKKMTFSDMKNEKMAVAAIKGKDFAISVGTSLLLPGGLIYIQRTNINKYKTERRLGEKDE